MAVTRTIYATIEIACCRDGDEVYHPLPRQIIAPQTKDIFEEPLNIWRDRAETALDRKYRQIAEDECSGMGTPRLCLFILTVDRVDETGLPEAPITVLDYIRTVESYINDSRDNIKDMEDRISDILVTPSEERTSAQRTEIRRLDEAIRRENEFIREYEREIRQLKEQYGID